MSSTRNSVDNTGDTAPRTSYDDVQPAHSLSQAVYARRDEYTRSHRMKIKVGTWNVAACSGVEKDVGAWFVQGQGIDNRLSGMAIAADIEAKGGQHLESVEEQEARRSKRHSTLPKNDVGLVAGGEDIGLYVLGLQEVVELTAAQYVNRLYSDAEPLAIWKKSMQESLPQGYELVSEQQLRGLMMLIYASPEVASMVSSVSTQSVSTGLGNSVLGYLGNKGAISTRLVLGETTRLVFINSHLASGPQPPELQRRCWEVEQILTRTVYDPISRGGVLDDHQERIGDEDFAFWFGDLNFRMEPHLDGNDIRRLLMLHTRGEYNLASESHKKIEKELAADQSKIVIPRDTSDDDSITASSYTTDATSLPDPDDFVHDPHTDPSSLQATLDSLLPHDQLARVMKEKRAFHDGWREGPITFLPTYRYDVGSMGCFDSSEKRRTPSWCDRILFRTRKDKLEHDGRSQEEALSKRKDKEMQARGIDHARDEEEILYEYDPEADGDEEEAEEPVTVITREGFLDRIKQEVYTSHQRVLSSDHKPVDAVFTIDYEAVVPELKSKIQQEVAREFDRAENEGRPSITVLVDSRNNHETELTQGVDFGEISYLRRVRKDLTIANTGQCSARFSFAKRPHPDGESVVPSWLTTKIIDNDNGLDSTIALEPGDAINVALEVYVEDINLLKSLNEALRLDDVIVLRVTNGRDHFIPVRGTWLPSCFGRSIDELIRIPEGGIRAASKGVSQNEVKWSAPRELFKLTEATEWLIERAIADNDMITNLDIPLDQHGWPFDPSTWSSTNSQFEDMRTTLVEALETDNALISSFPADIPAHQKLEVIADVLLRFLSSLSDGIITSELWEKLDERLDAREKTTTAEDKKSQVLDIMSTAPNHSISLVFLTTMLGKIAGEIAPVSAASTQSASRFAKNVKRSLSFKGNTAEDPRIVKRINVDRRYAEIFAPAICRGKSITDKEKRSQEVKQRNVVEVFLKCMMDQRT